MARTSINEDGNSYGWKEPVDFSEFMEVAVSFSGVAQLSEHVDHTTRFEEVGCRATVGAKKPTECELRASEGNTEGGA